MKFNFAHTRNIEPYIEAIKGRDEFIIKRDVDRGYGVINYIVNFDETFPDPSKAQNGEEANQWILRRDCRGLKFDLDTGIILAKPYHKFFNLNEREETHQSKVSFLEDHLIFEKLDGSMLHPINLGGKIYWCTKMGITNVSIIAESFIDQNPNINRFSYDMMEDNKTPIFEFCSRKQRIVLDYPEDRMVLTAIRDNFTGKYSSYETMKEYANKYNLDLVKVHVSGVGNIDEFMKYTRDIKDEEGFVIRFDETGQMLKLKGEWYVKIHKSLDNLRFEKDVIRLILDEQIDDVKSFLQPSIQNAVDAFSESMFKNMYEVSNNLYDLTKSSYDKFGGDKKRFATEVVNGKPENKKYANLLFSVWAGVEKGENSAFNDIKKLIANNTGSQGRVDSIKHLIGDISWYDPMNNNDT